MHALVCQGNGKYYVSAVFGYYKNVTATDEYERYVQEIFNQYYIVWDEKKKRLIKWSVMIPDEKYLIPQILIIDSERADWIINDKGEGCVNFLSKELLESFLDQKNQPTEILAKCRALDDGFIYNDTPEIKSDEDIKNLEWASGYFHDARIVKEKLLQDGTLYLRFDGTWGCEIEVWLWGDLEYDTSSRNPDMYDPYWSGSTIILQDGFVYFVDEDNMTVEKIEKGYCYFKARHMKYRIIPD